MARKPFKAVPLKVVSAPIGVRRSPWPARRGKAELSPIMIMLPLTVFVALLMMPERPGELVSDAPIPLADFGASERTSFDTETARFTTCNGPVRDNCVIDGDTFWYAGEKIRVADINTPEVSDPQCAREAQLGERASARLLALLNQGAFTLESVDRDRDPYGRLLRTVTREGVSVGAVLVREGLAEEWQGTRGGWC